MLSGKMNTMTITLTREQFRAVMEWQRNREAKIQEILPDHTSEEREFLLSGLSIEEQRSFFDTEQL